MLTQAEIRTALIEEVSSTKGGTVFAPVFVDVNGKKVEIPTLRATVVDGKTEDGNHIAFIEMKGTRDLYKIEDGKATVHVLTGRASYQKEWDALLPEPEEVQALRKQLESIQAPKGYRFEPNGRGGFDVVKDHGNSPKPKSTTTEKKARRGSFATSHIGSKVNQVDKEGKVVSSSKVKNVTAEGHAVLENGKIVPGFNRYYKAG